MNRLCNSIKGLGVVLFALLVGVLAGCETTSPKPAASKGIDPVSTLTTFHTGDKLMIEFDNGLPTPWNQTVREDGNITLPYNKSIIAAGKGKAELEQQIHDIFVPNILRRLTVNVRADDRTYFVDGEVRTPGQKVHTGNITATKAIAAAGDFTDFAKKSDIQINRTTGETIHMNAVKALRDPSLDVPVYPGDRVHVPRRLF